MKIVSLLILICVFLTQVNFSQAVDDCNKQKLYNQIGNDLQALYDQGISLRTIEDLIGAYEDNLVTISAYQSLPLCQELDAVRDSVVTIISLQNNKYFFVLAQSTLGDAFDLETSGLLLIDILNIELEKLQLIFE